jgi:predicted HD superfamily hydrolase involved in NAD metabolism
VVKSSFSWLAARGHPRPAAHCQAVAAQARRLAEQFAVDPVQAEQAGWLHDLSAVIPNAERLAAAQAYGLEVLPAEAAHPMLLHQKLSVVLARQHFDIQDPAILSAIGCHTTLRPASTPLDQVVFVADKIAWDAPGQPPYLPALQAALAISLPRAAWVYLDYLWQRRATLLAWHPWAAAAHEELCRPVS